MSRLTLSEQVANQANTIEELNGKLAVAERRIMTLELERETLLAQAELARNQAAEIAKAKEEREKLQKEYESAKSMREHYSKQADSHHNELEQAHAVLDGVDGAPPRSYRPEDSTYDRQRNVVTRLAGAFLAIAQKGGVK